MNFHTYLIDSSFWLLVEHQFSIPEIDYGYDSSTNLMLFIKLLDLLIVLYNDVSKIGVLDSRPKLASKIFEIY